MRPEEPGKCIVVSTQQPQHCNNPSHWECGGTKYGLNSTNMTRVHFTKFTLIFKGPSWLHHSSQELSPPCMLSPDFLVVEFEYFISLFTSYLHLFQELAMVHC